VGKRNTSSVKIIIAYYFLTGVTLATSQKVNLCWVLYCGRSTIESRRPLPTYSKHKYVGNDGVIGILDNTVISSISSCNSHWTYNTNSTVTKSKQIFASHKITIIVSNRHARSPRPFSSAGSFHLHCPLLPSGFKKCVFPLPTIFTVNGTDSHVYSCINASTGNAY
jgi:hypothetical protein